MTRLEDLYHRLLQGGASAKDHAAFIELLMEPEREGEARELLSSIAREEAVGTAAHALTGEQQEVLASSILTAAGHLKARPAPSLRGSVHRVHFLRKWGWAAASLILALGMATYMWISNDSGNAGPAPVAKKNEVIAPGGNKAILTLADGSRIVLDSAANGTLASQGNASIVKLANGQIAYNAYGSSQKSGLINTMTTPRGGQYQLVLPDGTKAWLNATSSITYPVAFTGKQRSVSVTGEVYFEVAQDKSRPFTVNIGNHSSVEVLGTHFNINSYADEGNVQTTLLEGSVKVLRAIPGLPEESVIIKPGQQVQMAATTASAYAEQGLQVIGAVNMEKVMAWKNGIFYFQDAALPQVMKQLERWYDISVQYRGEVPVLKINGKMDRGLTLQEVLEFLTKMEVHSTLEGRTITVNGESGI